MSTCVIPNDTFSYILFPQSKSEIFFSITISITSDLLQPITSPPLCFKQAMLSLRGWSRTAELRMTYASLGGAGATTRLTQSSDRRSCAGGCPLSSQGQDHCDRWWGIPRCENGGAHGDGDGNGAGIAAPCWHPKMHARPTHILAKSFVLAQTSTCFESNDHKKIMNRKTGQLPLQKDVHKQGHRKAKAMCHIKENVTEDH